MKIAVITFCNNGNFGSELQALAINDFCKQRGHSVIFCIPKSANKLKRITEILFEKMINSANLLFNGQYRNYYKQLKQNISLQASVTSDQQAITANFIKENIVVRRLSKRQIIRGDFDCWICGSDQIWSPLTMPFNSVFFLGGIPSSKKIAYAPSFGVNTLPSFFQKKAVKYIKEFDYLSVREVSAKESIYNFCDKDAQVVLDPTLMMEPEYWEKKVKCINEKYCLCYFLGDISPETADYINKIADGRKIILLYSISHCKKLNNAVGVIADPLDFVSYIHNADLIFTDSFHGTAFSIIFEKEFISFSRTQSAAITQTSRILSLLEQFGLTERFCNNVKDFSIKDKIDYSKVSELLNQKRAESVCFLENALKQVNNTINSRKG